MWEEFVITFVIGLVKQLIKNPGKAQSLKALLLVVRDDISALYPGE